MKRESRRPMFVTDLVLVVMYDYSEPMKSSKIFREVERYLPGTKEANVSTAIWKHQKAGLIRRVGGPRGRSQLTDEGMQEAVRIIETKFEPLVPEEEPLFSRARKPENNLLAELEARREYEQSLIENRREYEQSVSDPQPVPVDVPISWEREYIKLANKLADGLAGLTAKDKE